ncbi:prephenate dehydrogenase, partial [Marivirga lumbricoides]
ILEYIPETTTVVDMGSTKEKICNDIAFHPKRGCFVAAHPIAGTENTGPEAAIVDLFTGKKTIICEKEKSKPQALSQVEKLFRSLEMSIEYMTAKDHDLHIAYVSHLSHISSFTLGLTVLEKEKNEKLIFNMAGSGFASTVRLAKSSPEMWAPIFNQNSKNISAALGTYIENLQAFKEAIDTNDLQKTKGIMQQANAIRK